MSAKTAPPDRETEALERFQNDERALESALDDAKREAERMLAAARADAEAVRKAAEEEAARIRFQVKGDAAAESRHLAASMAGDLAREIAEISSRARRNEEAALAWLLAIVAGDAEGGTP